MQRAQKGAHEQAIGRSRGGLTTKIHAVGDALGNPIRLKLTGGQVHDSMRRMSGIMTISCSFSHLSAGENNVFVCCQRLDHVQSG